MMWCWCWCWNRCWKTTAINKSCSLFKSEYDTECNSDFETESECKSVTVSRHLTWAKFTLLCILMLMTLLQLTRIYSLLFEVHDTMFSSTRIHTTVLNFILTSTYTLKTDVWDNCLIISTKKDLCEWC